MSDVVTGEAVALDLRTGPAAVPVDRGRARPDRDDRRVRSDPRAHPPGRPVRARTPRSSAGSAVSLLVLVFLGYPVAMETLTRGRTLGKMALGLRVVRDDGGPIAFRQALVRGLVGLALGTAGSVPRDDRAGDRDDRRDVLRSREADRRHGRRDRGAAGAAAGRPQWTPVMPPPLAAWAPRLDLAGFDDALALSAREFLGRAGELVRRRRARRSRRELVDEVRSRTTPDPPPGTPGWAYLTAVLAERRGARRTGRCGRRDGRGCRPGWYPGWPAPAGRYAGGRMRRIGRRALGAVRAPRSSRAIAQWAARSGPALRERRPAAVRNPGPAIRNLGAAAIRNPAPAYGPLPRIRNLGAAARDSAPPGTPAPPQDQPRPRTRRPYRTSAPPHQSTAPSGTGRPAHRRALPAGPPHSRSERPGGRTCAGAVGAVRESGTAGAGVRRAAGSDAGGPPR